MAEIRQSLPLDCERLYALSGYFRSVEGAEVSLSVQGMTTAMLTEFVGSSWARLWLPVRLEEEGIGLTAGVRLLAGASVEVCGLQLEAQAAPGVYKASSVAGGIFDFARFGMDELVLTAEDEGSFRTEVTVFTEV